MCSGMSARRRTAPTGGKDIKWEEYERFYPGAERESGVRGIAQNNLPGVWTVVI